MVSAEPPYQVQHRFEVIDGPGITLRLPDHSMRAQECRNFGGVVRIDEPYPYAIEARVADHFKLHAQRPFCLAG
jgi:hypothetical protein